MKSKSPPTCPKCCMPLDWHDCSGAQEGCREPKINDLKAYPAMSEIAVPSVKAAWTIENWRQITAWTKEKDKETGMLCHPTLRARALEWLRMETLVLANQMGLFTEGGLEVFLSTRRMKNEARTPYLKRLLNESDPTRREEHWRLFRDDHAADLALAARGHHHGLLVPNSPEEPASGYMAFGYAVSKRPHHRGIEELKPTRVRTVRPGVPGYIERTVILPREGDIVMDETVPGVVRIAPNRRVVSVDLDAQGGAKALVEQLTQHIQTIFKEQGRQRGCGDKRLRDLARMWEALQLYRDILQDNSYKEIGMKALAFGLPPRLDAKNKIAFFERRGQKIVDLAEEMIYTALLPTQNAPWTRTFL